LGPPALGGRLEARFDRHDRFSHPTRREALTLQTQLTDSAVRVVGSNERSDHMQEAIAVSDVSLHLVKDNPDVVHALGSLLELNAALEKASQQQQSPVEVLTVVIREYSNYALRFPRRYRINTLDKPRVGSVEEQRLEQEFRRTLQIVGRLTQAAQEAGEFKGSNPTQTAARIVGAIHGLADFLLSGSGKLARDASLAQRSLLGLLDLFPENSGSAIGH
jgi:hypothetical protein